MPTTLILAASPPARGRNEFWPSLSVKMLIPNLIPYYNWNLFFWGVILSLNQML
jgi:hypothetical protein